MAKYRNGLVIILSTRGSAPTTPQGCALNEGGYAWGERMVSSS